MLRNSASRKLAGPSSSMRFLGTGIVSNPILPANQSKLTVSGIAVTNLTGAGVSDLWLCVPSTRSTLAVSAGTDVSISKLCSAHVALNRSATIFHSSTATGSADLDPRKRGYLKFERLTHIPIDKKCIDIKLLNQDEIQWIDNYHAEVYRKINPLISDFARDWLKKATSPLLGGK